jgi:hypothetical protein
MKYEHLNELVGFLDYPDEIFREKIIEWLLRWDQYDT